MYYIGTYGVKHYYADTESDVSLIPLADAAVGSTVFVISTSTHYMLNGNKQWIAVNLNSGNSGGGSGSSHIIYEGGGV